MQPVIRPLLLRHSDPALEACLRESVWENVTLVRAGDWASLRMYVERAPPGSVCVADPFGEGGRGEGISEDLRDVLRECPALTMVAAFEILPSDAGLLKTLFAWGVADVLDLKRENSRSAVSRRVAEVRKCWVERFLGRTLPRTMAASRARAMLGVMAQVAADGGGLRELCDQLRVGPRTVPRWCERAGLPHPRRLMTWLRLAMVAELLDDPRRSVQSAAHATGYVNSTSLKWALRNYLNLSPTDLRRAGAVATVVERFRDELRNHRVERRSGPNQNRWLN